MIASQIVLLVAACLAANMAAAQEICVNNVPVNGRRLQSDDSSPHTAAVDAVDAALSQPLTGRRLQSEARWGARKVGLSKADWDAWDGTYLKVDFINWEWAVGKPGGGKQWNLFKVTTSDNRNYACQASNLFMTFLSDQKDFGSGPRGFLAIQVATSYAL
jgi:hypothetical protein